MCRAGPRSDLLHLGDEVVADPGQLIILFSLKEQRQRSISQRADVAAGPGGEEFGKGVVAQPGSQQATGRDRAGPKPRPPAPGPRPAPTFCSTAFSSDWTRICSFLRLAWKASASAWALLRTWAISSLALHVGRAAQPPLASPSAPTAQGVRLTAAASPPRGPSAPGTAGLPSGPWRRSPPRTSSATLRSVRGGASRLLLWGQVCEAPARPWDAHPAASWMRKGVEQHLPLFFWKRTLRTQPGLPFPRPLWPPLPPGPQPARHQSVPHLQPHVPPTPARAQRGRGGLSWPPLEGGAGSSVPTTPGHLLGPHGPAQAVPPAPLLTCPAPQADSTLTLAQAHW